MFTDTLTARQQRAADVFARIFRTITVCVVLFAAVMLLECMVIRRGIVHPLLEYNESIHHGVIAPIHGVAELRTLAETYNSIYEENEEREMLMKHQAEHDSLTELLNRRSFDQILSLYEKDRSSFALILADVDVFKQINDTCGHDTGDRILKRVAALLHTTFRSTDYVCRIGGDEFAVIMVDMSRELYYTITDKIAEINGLLAVPEDGLPAVSLSAGVAFSDENGFCGSLFRAADSALYTAKAHGRCGCSVSPAPDETAAKAETRRIMTPETFRRQPGGPGAALPPNRCAASLSNKQKRSSRDVIEETDPCGGGQPDQPRDAAHDPVRPIRRDRGG